MRLLNINYYKPNGKYYTTEVINNPPFSVLEDAISDIRKCISIQKLPGLISGKWEGYILVELVEINNIGEETSNVSYIIDLKGYRD